MAGKTVRAKKAVKDKQATSKDKPVPTTPEEDSAQERNLASKEGTEPEEPASEEVEELKGLTEEELREKGLKVTKEFLKRRGLRVIDQNVETRQGTIDVVADDKDERVLILSQTELALGDSKTLPDLAVSDEEYRHLRQLLFAYLSEHYAAKIRLDMIALSIVGHHRARLRHLIGVYRWRDVDNESIFWKQPDADACAADNMQ